MHFVISSSLTAIKETPLRSDRVGKCRTLGDHEIVPLLYSIVHSLVHSTIPIHSTIPFHFPVQQLESPNFIGLTLSEIA